MNGDQTSQKDFADRDQLSQLIGEFGKALIDGVPLESLEQRIVNEYGSRAIAALHAIKWLYAFKQAESNPAAAAPSSDLDATLPGGSPWMFGRFQVIERLGAGGNGIVFRVFDSSLNRDAALKIPRPDIQWQPGLQRRFLQEARSAAALDHPNIVPIYETGIVNSVNFILSAYCSGPNLAQWLAAHKKLNGLPSARIAASWMKQIADGVEYSHSRGVAHRDLKPANIMLEPVQSYSGSLSSSTRKRTENLNSSNCTPACAANGTVTPDTIPLDDSPPDPEAFRPRIADFGMSKIDENDEAATVSEAIFGTLSYMAPEQAQGTKNAQAFGFDIYALGAILFEMLTGRPPLIGQNQIDLLRRLGTEYPPLPSTLRPDVPRDLEAICMKCLERDPTKRYQSAQDLKRELASFLAGEEVEAPKVHRSLNFLKPLIAHRLPVWIMCCIAVLLAVVSMAIGWKYSQASAERAKLSQTVTTVRSLLAKERDEANSRSKTANSLERTLDDIYVSDMQRANRIWQESRCLERDLPFAAADIKELLKRHAPAKGAVDRRRFEWYYLWRCCEPERFVTPPRRVGSLVGHNAAVYSVDFSPNAKWLATAGADGAIRIWDVDTQALQRTLVGHSSEVNDVTFSGDGELLASGSDDGTVRIWSVESGQEVITFTGHQSAVVGVAFHVHLPLVYSGDNEGVVKIWNVENKVEMRSIQAHAGRIQSLFRYPQESVNKGAEWQRFVTCSQDDFAKIWELDQPDEGPLMPLKEFDKTYPLEFFRIANHSPVIATMGYRDNGRSKVEFFRAENANLFAIESGYQLQSGGFTIDDSEFLIAGRGAPIRAVDIATRKSWNLTEPLEAWSLAQSRDGRHFATGEKSGNVTLWDCSANPRHSILTEPSRIGSGIEFSKDGRWMFARNQQLAATPLTKFSNFVIWDTTSKPPRACELPASIDPLQPLKNVVHCFTPNGLGLLLVSRDSADKWICRVFDLEALHEKFSFPVDSTGEIIQIACDDTRIYFRAPLKKQIDVSSYDFHSGKRQSAFSVPVDLTQNILSNNGKRLAIVERNEISFHDVDTGQRLHSIDCPFPEVSCLCFSPSSRQLAVGSARGKVRIVDIRDGSIICDLQGDTFAPIQSICFSADGQRIVGCGEHSIVVEMWSVPQKSHMLSLRVPGQNKRIRDLCFSPDGKTIGATYEYMPLDPLTVTKKDNPIAMILWQIDGNEASSNDAKSSHVP